MKKNFLLLAAVITSSLTKAQLADSVKSYDPVLITASKSVQKQSETAKVVTVITKEMLLRNSGKSLSDVLNQQAGLFIAGANNAPGNNQDLYFRGTGKVLLLLDGIPVYDASTINNAFDLNSIQIENLDKIEILKGAQSTLYGSDAIGGVINLITTVNTKKETEGFVQVQAGSFGTIKESIGIRGNTDGTTYAVQVSHWQSDGFSSATDSTGKQDFDKDGIRQTVFNGNIKGNLTKKLQIGLSTQYSTYTTDADGSAFTDDKDFTIKNRNFNAGLLAKYQLQHGTLQYNLNMQNTDRNYLNDSLDISGFSAFSKEKYIGRSYFTELYTTQQLHKNITLVAGIDYRWSNSNQDYLSISSFGPYTTSIGKDSVQQNMKSVYTSLFIKNNTGLHLEAGGRFNQHSTYGNNTTFSFNPGYSINEHFRIFANIASAFKAPSLYQLFAPGVANPQLKAESSVTYEAGIQYSNNNFSVRGVYFNRSIKNGLDYNLSTFAYFNNNTQNDQGAELETMAKIGKFSFTGNYAYLTGKVNTKKYSYNSTTYNYEINGDTTFNNLFRRPKNSANLQIAYQPCKSWHFTSSLHAIGNRWEGQFMSTPIVLKSYYTADLQIAYKSNRNCHIYADWRNITNRTYTDVLGYNTRSSNFMAGIQIMF